MASGLPLFSCLSLAALPAAVCLASLARLVCVFWRIPRRHTHARAPHALYTMDCGGDKRRTQQAAGGQGSRRKGFFVFDLNCVSTRPIHASLSWTSSGALSKLEEAPSERRWQLGGE